MDNVCDWLNSIGPQYGQYADLFEDQGWDDIDNVATMSETDIQTLGITKPGHVNKLKIAIKEINKQEQNVSPSESLNLQDSKNKQNHAEVQEQNHSKAANQNEESPGGATCHAITTEVHDGAQQFDREGTVIQDSQQFATESTVIADPRQMARECTVIAEQLQLAREDPLQSRSKGIVIEDPKIVTVQEDTNGDEKDKDTSDIDTALALTHGTQTDESSSNSDEDYTEPPHNVLMQLPPSHTMSAERRPIVAHLNAVSSRSVHRSTVVQGSKDVTIAETVEIHQHEHTDYSQNNYKGQIKTFKRNYERTEHLFVKTRAYKEVSDILEDSSWAVIIGNPGYGKSTMALHQMLEHSRQGYEPIIVTSVSDWKSMIEGQGKDSKKQFVLIDDIFGSVSVDERMLHDWSAMFDMIDKLIIEKKDDLKVICTTRKYIFSQVSTKLKQIKLFGKLFMVDMAEDQYELLQSEKVEMLTKYFQNYKVKTEETFIDSASKVTSDYGFPHCVEMFCTRTTLRERGLAFFETPLELLEKEIENLVKHKKDEYCALLMVLLSYEFHITYLDQYNPDQHNPELSPFSSDFGKAYLDKCITGAITNSLKLSRMRDDTFLPDFVSVFKLLNNVFIKEIRDGIYTFKHYSFKEIISMVTFKHYPELSLQLLDLDTIIKTTKYCTYKPSLQEMVVVLPKSCTSQLIKRFNKELQAGNGYTVSKHQAWYEKDFIVKWLQAIKSSTSFDRSCLVPYTYGSEFCRKYESGFLTHLCSNLKEEAVFRILEDNDLRNIFNSKDGIIELSCALIYACREDCSADLCILLIQHGAHVIYEEEEFNEEEYTEFEFKYIGHGLDVFRYNNKWMWKDEKGKAMSYALSHAICFDNLEKCKNLITRGASMFCEVFRNYVVLIAAENGSMKCLKYILEYIKLLELPRYFNKSKDFNTIEYLYGEIYSKFLCQLKTNISNPKLKPIHSSKNVQIYRILSKEYDTLDPLPSEIQNKEYDTLEHTLYEDNNEIPMILGLLETGCLTPDLIDILVEQGFDVNMKYEGEPITFHLIYKLLFQTAKTITVFESLFTHGLNLNATDKYGRTALGHILFHYNCYFNYDFDCDFELDGKKLLSWLLDMKIDPNIPDNEGCVPLFYALQSHNDMDILKMLLKQTEQLGNLTSISRDNCFHFLAYNHRLKVESVKELISLLLEENVNINHLNNEGRSCLAFTSDTNLELFLNHGADPNIQDEKSVTSALAFIDKNYRHSFIESLCILMKHNMNINAKNNKGQTIVHYLIKNGTCDLHFIDMFLKKSCDVNEKDNFGITPLMLVVGQQLCDESLLNLFIENGADCSSIDLSGRSVLDHCLESSLTDSKKADLMKSFISKIGFPGVTASSVTYALKECKQAFFLDKKTTYNGTQTLTTFFENVILLKDNIIDILKQILTSSISYELKAMMIRICLERTEDFIWLKDNINTEIHFNLLKSGKLLELFIKYDFINMNEYQNKVDVEMLPEDDNSASKVLSILEEKGICLGKVLTCFDQEPVEIKLAKEGKDQTLNIMLKYWNEGKALFRDSQGNTVLHYLAISESEDQISKYMVEQICQKTGFPCILNNNGETALHVACQSQPLKYQTLISMIRNSKHLNILSNFGMTAMHHLAGLFQFKQNSNISNTSTQQKEYELALILIELINHYANVDMQNQNGQTPLMYLLSNRFVGHVPRAIYVLINSVKDIAKVDIYGNNILHYLCSANMCDNIKYQYIQTLIWRGVNIDAVNSQGLTPVECCRLMYALKTVCTLQGTSTDTANVISHLLYCIEWFSDIHEHPGEIIEAINQVKINVNAPSLDGGITLLSQCCRFHMDTKIIEVLLQQGANPNIRDNSGFTSLHWLLFAGKMMSFSIQKCYCFHQDIESEEAFQHLNTYPWDKPKNMIQTLRDIWVNYQNIQLQYKHFRDRREVKDVIRTLNDIWEIPRYHVHTSTMKDVNLGLNILYILLRNNADPNIMDNEGRSPLHYCAMSPIIDGFTCVAMQMLIDFGADVNLEDINGQTPLMLCAELERTKHRRINILIEAGANLLAVDYNGRETFDHTQVCIGKLVQKQLKSDMDGVQNIYNNSIA